MIKKALGVQRSSLLRGFFAHPSGVLRELPKVSERIPEGFPKKTIKRQGTNTKKIKLPGSFLAGIIEYLFHRGSVHTLQFPFSTTPFLRSTVFQASGFGVCGERIYSLCTSDATHKLFVDECHRPSDTAGSIKPLLPQRRYCMF